MNQPLRYIQIGTGGWGGYWCATVLPRLAEMGKAIPAAAVDINPDNLKRAQDCLKLPVAQCYTDPKRAFAENKADFAIVVVPPAHHESVVDMALEHNLHILCEKPIADSMDACCRVYRKVKAAGKRMAVTMSHRFDQDKQTLEREIKSGKHGRLNYVIGRNTWNCRKFGSWGNFRHKIPDTLLIEGTVHHFDILRALTGSNAKTVCAVTWNPPWGEFAGDSNGLVTIQMANGVKALYEGNKTSATQLNGWCKDYFRAECELATLELDNRCLRILSDLSGERVIIEKPLVNQPVWTNAWLAEMFCDWLRGERDQHPTHLDDNIQCAALLFAAVESAHCGRPVDVQEFLQSRLAS
ncbi:MAG: Gfo/Idh/MocA family oxidoreductase [Verrucomicrobia bacterium]|nr:Gfo/Idh/MocA family oxidoreductase [Verrucomicrobiota bacterium]